MKRIPTNKRTSRTTRSVDKAIRVAKLGGIVLYVCANVKEVKRIRNIIIARASDSIRSTRQNKVSFDIGFIKLIAIGNEPTDTSGLMIDEELSLVPKRKPDKKKRNKTS